MIEHDGAAFVPRALATRVDAALGAPGPLEREAGSTPGVMHSPASPTPGECMTAGERLLDEVLRGAGRDRGTALDLLAADALVTRAFELAASEPRSLESLARESMRRIAALVDIR